MSGNIRFSAHPGTLRHCRPPRFLSLVNPVIADQPFLFKPPANQAAAGAAPRNRMGGLAGETHREITDILRELASVSREDLSVERFFAKLADGILRAMAVAKGVVIWTRDSKSEFSATARIGQVTDRSITGDAVATHDCLLQEVFQAGTPVTVPSTPGANSPDVPANPTNFPAAIVPIDVGATSPSGLAATGTVIQVFLEEGESVVAQRGYLRFIAQMADLTGEFLRSRRLRELQADQAWTKRIDQWVEELNRISHPTSIAERIADLMVEGIGSNFDAGFDRAAYLRCPDHRSRYRVVAVSHVEQVDHKSDAVQWLIDQATTHADLDHGDVDPVWLPQTKEETEASTAGEAKRPSGQLRVAAVLPVSRSERKKVDLVVLLRSGNGQTVATTRRHVQRFLNSASVAMRHADTLNAIPARRFLLGLNQAEQPTSGSRRWLLRGALATVLILMACLPISMNMTADATLRPSNVQRVCAPRDSIVQSVFVSHGQLVQAGDPLINLDDSDLNEQLATLHGRRSVLLEKRGVWTEELVDPGRRGLSGNKSTSIREDAQTQRQLTEAELRGIEQEIKLLEAAKASLTIVADRDGYIDAWQMESDGNQRPVQRGDRLLSVVDGQSDWYADASFAQSRVQHLNRTEDGSRNATICPISNSGICVAAEIDQIGPAVMDESTSQRTSVRLRLKREEINSSGQDDSSVFREGAPVKVLVRCGRKPLVYVLFQDAIDWVRMNVSLYGAST